ncbi:MAG TPA: hypothetical protein VNS32_10970, partial [Flavisolibacter sp.]|nr:hypothetical protein [Flavisolibacter sp.]
SRETGMPLQVYASSAVWQKIQQLNQMKDSPIRVGFQEFTDWNDFLIFSREVGDDDLFMIVSSRKKHLSYIKELEKIPYYLNKYFKPTSYLISFPEQWPGQGEDAFLDSSFVSMEQGGSKP